MTYCPSFAACVRWCRRTAKVLFWASGNRPLGIVNLTEQSPCILCPTTGTVPWQLTACVCQPTRTRGFETESRGPTRQVRAISLKLCYSAVYGHQSCPFGGGISFSTVSAFRKMWKAPKRHELWFRAEDELHRKTRLQPGIYRPNESSGKRKSVRKLLELENDLYEEFGRCSTQLSDVKSNRDDWEWDSFFLMQLHGVPTRLLDWSDGGLIALHFAVRDKPIPPKGGSIIYVLDPYWMMRYLDEHPDRKDAKARWKKYWTENPHPHDVYEDDWDRLYLPSDEDDFEDPLAATPEIPILWDSPHVTRRVAAQRSRFMIFGTDPLFLTKLEKEKDSRLVPIKVPVGSVNRVKQELKDAGITESVVYPDLDGLGRELKQVWKARR